MKGSSAVPGGVIAGLGFGVAAGVALGALVLAPSMDTTQAGGGTSDSSDYEKAVQDKEIARAQANSSDSVVREFSADTVRDTLSDRPVLVISTPDAADGDLRGLQSLLHSAGAPKAGHLKLTEDFFTQDKADELKSIVANTLPAGAKLSEDKISPGTHAGQALGAAMLMDPDDAQPLASVDDRAQLLQALRKAGFIDYEDGTMRPAQAVLLVTGSEKEGYATETLGTFAEALEEVGGNTVLAGRVEQAAPDGVIGSLRGSDSQVSTVDSVDRSFARMAAVLAIAEQLDGGHGAYGSAASAEAAAPAKPESN
ncbi:MULTISPECIES: copper transporter [unclassified Corynebacterium]|uniref:copper transporter n=1 Tax=unclassified Corynebacterium TaxID=2624378 RepID=UPI0034CDEB6B